MNCKGEEEESGGEEEKGESRCCGAWGGGVAGRFACCLSQRFRGLRASQVNLSGQTDSSRPPGTPNTDLKLEP